MFERIKRIWNRKESRAGQIVTASSKNAIWTKNNARAFAEEGYQRNVIAYQAINKIADSVASVPLMLMRRDEEIAEHPLLSLLDRPNPVQSGIEFMRAHVGFFKIAGNAYMERVTANGTPRELYTLRPDRMKVIPGDSGFPKGYVYKVGQNAVAWDWEFDGSDIRHFKTFNPLDDWYGLSPLEPGAYSIDQHNELMAWIQSLVQNGTMPSGALESSSEGLTDEQYERLKAQIDEQYSGAANAGRPMLLEGGLKWTQMGLSPDQMSAIENKHSAARDVSLAIGVPPLLLNIPGDGTYSNYKEARLALYEETSIPLIELICDELNNWIVPMYGDNLRLVPDIDAIPAIAEKRREVWSMADSSQELTINEKREIKGFDAIDGGDAIMVQSSLIPLELATMPFEPEQLPRGLDDEELKALAYGPSERS